MAKRTPIVVAGIAFKSQSALYEHALMIEGKYPPLDPPNQRSAILTGDDFTFVRDFLNRHPRASNIIGSGIAEIWLDTDGGAHRDFFVRRTDGTTSYFGKKKCVRPTMGTPSAEFKVACRDAIKSDMRRLRDDFFSLTDSAICPVRGVAFSRDTADVDHVVPWDFRRLVETFIGVAKVNVESVRYVYSTRGFNHGPRFADRALAAAWIQWHDVMADLRVVCRAANLNECRRKYGH